MGMEYRRDQVHHQTTATNPCVCSRDTSSPVTAETSLPEYSKEVSKDKHPVNRIALQHTVDAAEGMLKGSL